MLIFQAKCCEETFEIPRRLIGTFVGPRAVGLRSMEALLDVIIAMPDRNDNGKLGNATLKLYGTSVRVAEAITVVRERVDLLLEEEEARQRVYEEKKRAREERQREWEAEQERRRIERERRHREYLERQSERERRREEYEQRRRDRANRSYSRPYCGTPGRSW